VQNIEDFNAAVRVSPLEVNSINAHNGLEVNTAISFQNLLLLATDNAFFEYSTTDNQLFRVIFTPNDKKISLEATSICHVRIPNSPSKAQSTFPSACGSSGHQLFISAFMISSKVMCDDTYSNKSRSVVTQGMFNLREINQIEREMCNYLEWELTVANPMLSTFETDVKKDFHEQKSPYPTYPTSFVSKCAARAETSTSNTPFQEQSSTSSPVPGFTQNGPPGAKPGTPTKGSWGSSDPSPHMLDTPSPTFSHKTSPTSISGSPATPDDGPDPNPKICGVDIRDSSSHVVYGKLAINHLGTIKLKTE
jgi:hypothetical protein